MQLDNRMSTGTIRNLIANRYPGEVIYWGSEPYDLTNWGVALQTQGDLVMTGRGAVLRGNGGGFILLGSADKVDLYGLHFAEWDMPLETNGAIVIASLEVGECTFTDVASAIVGQRTSTIKDIDVSDCTVSQWTGTAFRFANAFDRALICRNTGSGGGRCFVGLGNTAEGDAENQHLWKCGVIEDNVVSDVQRQGECHFALCGGENFTISNNRLTRVGAPGTNEDGNEPIYTKARHSFIESNSFDTCGSSLIALKGLDRGYDGEKSSPYGYGNLIAGNKAWGSESVMIRSYTGDLLIQGNQCEGLALFASSGSNLSPVMTQGNQCTNMSRGGITISGRASHVVDGNLIRLADRDYIQTGISYRGSPEGPATNCSITGNQIHGGGGDHAGSRGISLWQGNDIHHQIDGLEISGNRVSGLPCGVWSKGSGLPEFVGSGAWIHHNWFATPVDASSGIKGGANVTFENNHE